MAFSIFLQQIEEWQMTNNITDLKLTFTKAKSSIVQGEPVLVVRNNPDGSSYTAQELTTEKELAEYRETVFRYLSE